MDNDKPRLGAAVDEAAWRIVELNLAVDQLPPDAPERGLLLDEAAGLWRRIDALLLRLAPHLPAVHDDCLASDPPGTG